MADPQNEGETLRFIDASRAMFQQATKDSEGEVGRMSNPANRKPIHSDETREEQFDEQQLYMIKFILENGGVSRNRSSDDAKTILRYFKQFLAKEQTRLLDRVLEGLPNERFPKIGITSEVWINDGFNACLTEVTTTIQKLKGEK